MDQQTTAAKAEPPKMSAGSAAKTTPMMRQYLEIKAANSDSLLFYRMGDFYELFFDDAVKASEALGITLTKRGKHAGDDIPMCGVPVVSADDYLQKLISSGFRVAVCEQLEDPSEAKKRGSKAVVKRDVVRLVTPGTITEDALLDPRSNNFLASVSRIVGAGKHPSYGIAWADMSTGEIAVTSVDGAQLASELARVDASELLVADSLAGDEQLEAILRTASSRTHSVPDALFDSVSAEKRLCAFYGVATLDGFGDFDRSERAALAALVGYAQRTQVDEIPSFRTPRQERPGTFMAIDPATRDNLEILRTLSGKRPGSLLHAIDRSATPAGARMLSSWITAPLAVKDAVRARHDAVASLVDATALRGTLGASLKGCPDVMRALSRLALDRGGPRDLGAVRSALAAAAEITESLASDDDRGALLSAPGKALACVPRGVGTALEDALNDELPVHRRDGNYVRAGYCQELDDARALRDGARKVIAGLENEYREATGIRALKVRHNNFLGYFIEVPAQHGERLIDEKQTTFIHRQSLPTARRFTTSDLADLQTRIEAAANDVERIESDVFADLRSTVLTHASKLRDLAEALAVLDVLVGFASLAVERDFVRPQMRNDSCFHVRNGRHAVVEQALGQRGAGEFVANDCELSAPDDSTDGAGLISLVTGPNMAGKSTYLRQNALIAILAQAGSFVPADSAKIGIVDRLFSRVGAADDIARGRSTFMVEMVETATILNQATDRSLVILDEIGRGTATYDGLSIAWAVLEYLHESNRCRALFATHFHELAALTETLPRLRTATLKVREWDGDVVFLHEVVAGAADQSYGVQVARLAGLPGAVIERARAILKELEATERGADAKALVADLPLFSAKGTVPSLPTKDREIVQAIRACDPDQMTPREALDCLYRLKALAPDREADT